MILSGVFRFSRVSLGCRWVHQRSFCSLARAFGSLGTSGFTCVRSGGCLVNSGSLGSFAYTLRGLSWVFGFARARPGDRWVHLGSMGSLTRPGCRWVRSRAPVGWLGSSGVQSRAPWWSLGSSVVIWFTRSRLWGRWVHPG